MKKQILLLFGVFLLAQGALVAQTQKGSVMLGGTAGVNVLSSGGDSYTLIHLEPNVGFFVIDKLAIGGSVVLQLGTGDGSTTTDIGLGPLIRYYFNGSGKFRAFGQGAFAWASHKEEGFDASTAFGYEFGVGGDIFLNDHVALEGILGYRYTKNNDTDRSFNQFGINFGIQAFIGGN